jgi:ankyrin repeat protein
MIKLENRKRVLSLIVIMALAVASGSRCSRSRNDLLYGAVCDGDIQNTRRLLMLGGNVNTTDVRSGYSLLMIAEACTAGPGRAELVELLIANGALVNAQARDGRNALMFAAKNGDTGAVKALLKSGASVNVADNEGQTALMKAVTSSCNEDTIRVLIDAGSDLKATDHKGQSALSSTCLKDTKLGETIAPGLLTYPGIRQ